MTDNLPEKEKKEPVFGEKKIGGKEEVLEEKIEKLEKREGLSERDRLIKEELKKELEMAEVSPELKEEAQKKAKEIEGLGQEGKLNRLLELAKERGLAFAVNVAQNMNDPYILDRLHDILARGEFYKKFKK